MTSSSGNPGRSIADAYAMTPAPVPTAREVTGAYVRAWLGGDVEAAMDLVADGVVCQAPGGTITGREGYRGFLEPFATALLGGELIDVLGDEAHAVAVFTVETPFAKEFRGMEYLTVEDGLITEAVAVFDRLPAAQARAAAGN